MPPLEDGLLLLGYGALGLIYIIGWVANQLRVNETQRTFEDGQTQLKNQIDGNHSALDIVIKTMQAQIEDVERERDELQVSFDELEKSLDTLSQSIDAKIKEATSPLHEEITDLKVELWRIRPLAQRTQIAERTLKLREQELNYIRQQNELLMAFIKGNDELWQMWWEWYGGQVKDTMIVNAKDTGGAVSPV